MTSEIAIATDFNNIFTNIGPDLARKIPTALITLWSFLNKIDTTMPADSVTINELKEAFFYLKTNKSPVYDKINSNVIENYFN